LVLVFSPTPGFAAEPTDPPDVEIIWNEEFGELDPEVGPLCVRACLLACNLIPNPIARIACRNACFAACRWIPW